MTWAPHIPAYYILVTHQLPVYLGFPGPSFFSVLKIVVHAVPTLIIRASLPSQSGTFIQRLLTAHSDVILFNSSFSFVEINALNKWMFFQKVVNAFPHFNKVHFTEHGRLVKFGTKKSASIVRALAHSSRLRKTFLDWFANRRTHHVCLFVKVVNIHIAGLLCLCLLVIECDLGITVVCVRNGRLSVWMVPSVGDINIKILVRVGHGVCVYCLDRLKTWWNVFSHDSLRDVSGILHCYVLR